MDIYMIGIHYYDCKCTNIKGFRLLDYNKCNYLDVPIENVVRVLKEDKYKIIGLEIKNDKLVGTNGALERYAKLYNNKVIENSIVILKEVPNYGYVVSDYKGMVTKLSTFDTIEVANKIGCIANGKIVNKLGKRHISSINGNYTKLDTLGSSKYMKIERSLSDSLTDLEKESLGGYKNSSFNTSFVLKVKDINNELISIAMCSIPTKKELESEIDYLVENYKQSCVSEYNEWKYNFINRLENGVYIEYIKSLNKGIGGARLIIDYIISQYDKLWLYSAYEAIEYWEDKIGLYASEEYFYSNELI